MSYRKKPESMPTSKAMELCGQTIANANAYKDKIQFDSARQDRLFKKKCDKWLDSYMKDCYKKINKAVSNGQFKIEYIPSLWLRIFIRCDSEYLCDKMISKLESDGFILELLYDDTSKSYNRINSFRVNWKLIEAK